MRVFEILLLSRDSFLKVGERNEIKLQVNSELEVQSRMLYELCLPYRHSVFQVQYIHIIQHIQQLVAVLAITSFFLPKSLLKNSMFSGWSRFPVFSVGSPNSGSEKKFCNLIGGCRRERADEETYLFSLSRVVIEKCNQQTINRKAFQKRVGGWLAQNTGLFF